MTFLPPLIASIIESCWLTHPEERPAIEEIIDQLEMYKPTPQEEQKIVDSLKAEVKENNAHAQYNLALRYFKGAGVEKSFKWLMAYSANLLSRDAVSLKYIWSLCM